MAGLLTSAASYLWSFVPAAPSYSAPDSPSPPPDAPRKVFSPRFAVGSTVYVARAGAVTWVTPPAMVAVVNDDGTYVVLLADDTEADALPDDHLHPAPATPSGVLATTEECAALRQQGNTAFQAGCAVDALPFYQAAIARLETCLGVPQTPIPSIQIGSRVMRGSDRGVVACLDADTADVFFDDGPDEDAVPLTALRLEPSPEGREAEACLVAGYLNVARCLLHSEAPPPDLTARQAAEEAARLCGLSLDLQGPPATGRYLRGRALGRCDRHEEAVADLMESHSLEPSDKQVERHLQVARRQWKEQQREDRRLLAAILGGGLGPPG